MVLIPHVNSQSLEKRIARDKDAFTQQKQDNDGSIVSQYYQCAGTVRIHIHIQAVKF